MLGLILLVVLGMALGDCGDWLAAPATLAVVPAALVVWLGSLAWKEATVHATRIDRHEVTLSRLSEL